MEIYIHDCRYYWRQCDEFFTTYNRCKLSKRLNNGRTLQSSVQSLEDCPTPFPRRLHLSHGSQEADTIIRNIELHRAVQEWTSFLPQMPIGLSIALVEELTLLMIWCEHLIVSLKVVAWSDWKTNSWSVWAKQLNCLNAENMISLSLSYLIHHLYHLQV